MSVLSDVSIRAQLDAGRLVVTPLADDAIRPSSIDLRLGPVLLIAEPGGGHREHHLINHGPYTIYQHVFLLGATLEWVELPDDLVGLLVGKSTRARQGLQVESAGLVDPGWRGRLTVEVVNLAPAPIALTLGMAICQLSVSRMTTPAEHPYAGRYQKSDGPVAARAERRSS
jgi:dCTP deaminase